MTYWANGQPGTETDYSYNDVESRLTDIHYPAHPEKDVHVVYDRYGRAFAVQDASGSRSVTFDDLNEALSVSTTYTGVPEQTLSYSYNPDGSRNSMTTPAGNFTYSYDGTGRPSSLTNPYGETSGWSYADNNWLQTQTLPNGAVTTYSCNAAGMLTELQNATSAGQVLSDFNQMQYDGAGNKTSQSCSMPGSPAASGTTNY